MKGNTALGSLMMAAPGLWAMSVNAAVITVNTEEDVINDHEKCSLRAAIISANTNTAVGGCISGEPLPVVDVIEFGPGVSTVDLTISGAGENASYSGDLDITESVNIVGESLKTIIRMRGSDFDERIMSIHAGAHVKLEGLTFAHGVGAGEGGVFDFGGCILVYSDSSIILDRVLAFSCSAEYGGGIYLAAGSESAYIKDSIIDSNFIVSNGGGAGGGGIYSSRGGSLFIWNSRVTENYIFSNGGSAFGGGVFLHYGQMEIDRASIAENYAIVESGSGDAYGGAVFSQADIKILNSTISGNVAEVVAGSAFSGGIYTLNGDVVVNNVIVSSNSSTASSGLSYAGGFYVSPSVSASISNTIVAGNAAQSGAQDCFGEIYSEGYNLIGNNVDCAMSAVYGDQIGTFSNPIDPPLYPLDENGGSIDTAWGVWPHLTHRPLEGSPVIDEGNPQMVLEGTPPHCETADQRGHSRPQNGGVSLRCDIGAFEAG